MEKILPKIALGAWSWGAGAAGGDQVFGNHLSEVDSSERILGAFVKDVRREDIILSTQFTPQIASGSSEAMQEMLDGSKAHLHTDTIDILTDDEIKRLEKLGDETGISTLREWEKEM